jgi:hypothetical protein
MKDRIKSMMPNGIAGLERVKTGKYILSKYSIHNNSNNLKYYILSNIKRIEHLCML